MASNQPGLHPPMCEDVQDQRLQWHAQDKTVFHGLPERPAEIQREAFKQPCHVRAPKRSGMPGLVALMPAYASAFVREGFEAAARETPLPDDYRRLAGTDA